MAPPGIIAALTANANARALASRLHANDTPGAVYGLQQLGIAQPDPLPACFLCAMTLPPHENYSAAT